MLYVFCSYAYANHCVGFEYYICVHQGSTIGGPSSEPSVFIHKKVNKNLSFLLKYIICTMVVHVVENGKWYTVLMEYRYGREGATFVTSKPVC